MAAPAGAGKGGPTTPRRGQQPHRMLIILAGLMRTFRHAWPVLVQELQLDALEAAGIVVADVAIHTSLDMFAQAGERSPASLLVTIRQAYAHRLRLVMDAPLQAKAENGDALDARVRDLVRSSNLTLPQYNSILALRPDAILISKPDGNRFRALNPAKLCATHRGASIIGGSVLRKYFFHNRDWDHGFLLCPPARIRDWLMFRPRPGERCAEWEGCLESPPRPPPRPAHITGTWFLNGSSKPKDNLCTIPQRSLCDRALRFHLRGIPFDALPENVALAHLLRYVAREGRDEPRRPFRLCTTFAELPDHTFAGPAPDARRQRAPACKPYRLPLVSQPTIARGFQLTVLSARSDLAGTYDRTNPGTHARTAEVVMPRPPRASQPAGSSATHQAGPDQRQSHR